MEFQQERTSSSKKKVAIISAILALIIIIIILLITSCGRSSKDIGTVFDLSTDANSRSGGLSAPDISSIQEELNRKVEEGMINISMNMNPCFESGSSEGDVLIVNSEVNRYPQVIEIYLKDSGDLVYRSGAIPVGSCVEYGTLLKDLDAGSYEAVAYFNAVNPDTGLLVGKAGAEILITVKS